MAEKPKSSTTRASTKAPPSQRFTELSTFSKAPPFCVEKAKQYRWNPSTLHRLSTSDIWCGGILPYLPLPAMISVLRVNRSLFFLCMDTTLWRALIIRDDMNLTPNSADKMKHFVENYKGPRHFYELYRRRHLMQIRLAKSSNVVQTIAMNSVNEIQVAVSEFVCPMQYEDMEYVTIKGEIVKDVRRCQVCNRNVKILTERHLAMGGERKKSSEEVCNFFYKGFGEVTTRSIGRYDFIDDDVVEE
eukprot:PhF_6_TR41080/c0_g1_i2/m.62237